MEVENRVPNGQAAAWNGDGGRAWVDLQELLDRLFMPFQQLLVAAVRTAAARSVLDVGCGTGSTSLAIARLLGRDGRCLGVDISKPMIALARARAQGKDAPAGFIQADAQAYAFEPASIDMIVSRFGVMFFDDPVAAFRNLRQAVRPGGELRFFAWRSAAENPFMTTAERAAAPLLPGFPARRSVGPGQFAFADRERVQFMLEESGWSDVAIDAVDVLCAFPLAHLETYFTRLGPLGLLLAEEDDRTRARVVAAVGRAFDPFVSGDQVRFTAACWTVGARAPEPGGCTGKRLLTVG